jgi:hypothetical protein
MNDNNRVLTRRGARELDEKEVEQVGGGLRTQTVCTHNGTTADGDAFFGEC